MEAKWYRHASLMFSFYWRQKSIGIIDRWTEGNTGKMGDSADVMDYFLMAVK